MESTQPELDDAVLDRLAREILMVDAEGQSLIPQYERAIEAGLDPIPVDTQRKDVIIVGAGMAGLLAGTLLKRSGFNVTILEANDRRTGGRVKTFHSQSGNAAFHDPKQYGEAGAMRIPTTHPLVNKLIDVSGLRSLAQPFFNVDVAKDDANHKLFRTWIDTNDVRARKADYDSGNLPAEQRTMGFPIPDKLRNQTADAILTTALAQPNSWLKVDPQDPPDVQTEKLIAGWKKVIRMFDEYSMLRYLREYFFSLGMTADETPAHVSLPAH
jgi:monoamine oxidase